MPAQALPVFDRAQVASHNSRKSCYVTIASRVYDVTDFLADHPGGDDLILEYAGKDISDILEDEVSHKHSDAAYEILGDNLIGYVKDETDSINGSAAPEPGDTTAASANGTTSRVYKTGVSSEEGLSVETDPTEDFKTHKFIDLNKPMFMQVWRSNWSRDFYLEQVHRPRYYRGGEAAPFFGNFLEPLSKAPWYIVPTVWLPAVSYGLYRAYEGIQDIPHMALLFFIGVCAWTLIEYTLHKGLFHVDQYGFPIQTPSTSYADMTTQAHA